jgi:hypothetical protein
VSAGEISLQSLVSCSALLFDIARRMRDRLLRVVVTLGQDTLCSGCHLDAKIDDEAEELIVIVVNVVDVKRAKTWASVIFQ